MVAIYVIALKDGQERTVKQVDYQISSIFRVQSGKFGQTAKFGQPLCLFHSSIIGIKNKLTKQTVKILSSGFSLFANVCPNLPDVRIYPTLPYSFQTNEFSIKLYMIKLG